MLIHCVSFVAWACMSINYNYPLHWRSWRLFTDRMWGKRSNGWNVVQISCSPTASEPQFATAVANNSRGRKSGQRAWLSFPWKGTVIKLWKDIKRDFYDVLLVGGFKHGFYFPFHIYIYGMSSQPYWRSPSFFKMGTLHTNQGFFMMFYVSRNPVHDIPSGKHTKNYGKSPCSMGKSTMFNG